jgi:hypothetical protein
LEDYNLNITGNTTGPTVLNVEYLIVADAELINQKKVFMRIEDQNQLFPLLKIYFAHLINGVIGIKSFKVLPKNSILMY